MMTTSAPRRVFLDTCVVNFLLDYSEQIHQGVAAPRKISGRKKADIEALANIWDVGERAFWELAISPLTYREVSATNDPKRCTALESWFSEIWENWRQIVRTGEDLPTFIEAEEIRIGIIASRDLDVLPDMSDRMLLSDAIVYGCDLFCTRDWCTVLKHRNELQQLPIRIVAPVEWWAEIDAWLKQLG